MPHDVIIGRNTEDKKRFGSKGLLYIGKSYVTMGSLVSLSNPIYLDVARTHVVLIAGKRGSGKSYTLAALAESISDLPRETSKNIAPIIFDTMGIFWTMKYKNEKDSSLLKSWNLEPKNLPVKVFVPFGKSESYSASGIEFDSTFALAPSDLNSEDWISMFNLSITSLPGVLISRIISDLSLKNKFFNIKDITSALDSDKLSSKETKEIVLSLFYAASTWGIFSEIEEESVSLSDLVNPGTTTVLDTSIYSSSSSFNIRALVISLISKKLFTSRMEARKKEEISSIRSGYESIALATEKSPLIWIFIDEAHEFLPKTGKTPATDMLVKLLREGRQPGISLVLATQQPGQIHNDVMTQSDIVLSHRLTSKQDISALNEIMQSYVLTGIQKEIDSLPSLKGSAIILDDNSERIYPLRVRPRFTWHGGEAPTAIKPESNF